MNEIQTLLVCTCIIAVVSIFSVLFYNVTDNMKNCHLAPVVSVDNKR